MREKTLSKISDIYHKHHGVDGYRSMQVYLEREGFSYSRTTVHKYMNSILGLKSIVRPKKPDYEHGKPHKVKDLKRLGRGYRNFEHFRTRFLYATRDTPVINGINDYNPVTYFDMED